MRALVLRCFSSPYGADRPTAEIVLVVPPIKRAPSPTNSLEDEEKGKVDREEGSAYT